RANPRRRLSWLAHHRDRASAARGRKALSRARVAKFSWIRASAVARRVGNAGAGEAVGAQAAGVAVAASAAFGVGLVAGHRRREIYAEALAFADDVGLAHVHQWGVD